MKALIKEKLVDGISQSCADSGDGTKGIGTRSQMSLGAQIFKGVSFFCNRVAFGIIDQSHHAHFGRLDFECLSAPL